jgi:hypothetical protein
VSFVFTAAVTDPTLYSPLFVDAVAWRLAADIAMTQPKSRDLRKDALEMWRRTLEQARLSVAHQSQGAEPPDSEFVAARA